MHRLTIVLPLLAALCACRSDRHQDEYDSSPGAVATAPASANKSDMLEPRPTLTKDDKKFIEEATIGGMFAVQSARIAQLEDISRASLEFAQLIVDSHGRSNRELDMISRMKGVIPPTRLDDAHQSELDELQRLDGPAFERAYRALAARTHDDAIEFYERSAKKVDDAQLAAFIERILPTLREHRQYLMENISSR